MNPQSGSQEALVLSYLELRKAVGIIGLTLPFVLALGKIFLGSSGIQPTISDYYETHMRDVFVGSLCAIGVFLMSYRYGRVDRIAGRLACVFAIGVALFPTGSAIRAIHSLHLWCAGLLFLTLAYFSLGLFTKTGGSKEQRTRQKIQRNRFYYVCGYTILACIAGLVCIFLLGVDDRYKPRFWLESIAIIAFGVSWLIKGETILKDEKSEKYLTTTSGAAI